jgi:superoxide dismutase
MPYAVKPMGCNPARIKGMSERLIVSHYENNYGGAVKRLNPIDEQLAELDYAKAAGFVINGLKREQALAGGAPILAPDAYEHSYHMHFSVSAAGYVAPFLEAIRWNNADRQFVQVTGA